MGLGKGTGRGGKREGAGAKPDETLELARRVSAVVGVSEYTLIMELGNGNGSAGVRAALRELMRYRESGAPAMKSISTPAVKRKPFVPEVASVYYPDGRKRGITQQMQHEAEVAQRNRVAYAKYLNG